MAWELPLNCNSWVQNMLLSLRREIVSLETMSSTCGLLLFKIWNKWQARSSMESFVQVSLVPFHFFHVFDQIFLLRFLLLFDHTSIIFQSFKTNWWERKAWEKRRENRDEEGKTGCTWVIFDSFLLVILILTPLPSFYNWLHPFFYFLSCSAIIFSLDFTIHVPLAFCSVY